MRTQSLGAGALALAVVLGACNSGAGGGSDEVVPAEEIDVPSPEEAAAEAQTHITDENAEAELERLSREIDSGQ